jgi:hypothetical protein
MKTLRWLLFIPVAAALAIACGFGISGLMPTRSYSEAHPFLSLISPQGLAPFILERMVPVALFILVGSILAPSPGRKVVVILGVFGGLVGAPFGPQYSLAGGSVFFAAAALGSILGCAIGLVTAFMWQAKLGKK